MRWFKHFTDWHTDKDICEAERVLNLCGYRFYITLKEIYGENYNECDKNGYLEYNYKIFKQKLRLNNKKTKKLLSFFQGKKRLFYSINDDIMSVKIPEFMRLASKWEKEKESKKRQITGKKQQTEERRTEEKEERRKEEETDEFIFDISQKILDDLNAKTKKNFSDKSFIVQQIRKGKKPEDFFTITENKLLDPFFQKNPKLYNPKTLFGDEHFDAYLNERSKPEEREEKDESAEKTVPYQTVRKIYKTYLDTELSAAQDALHYLVHNYNNDDVNEGGEIADILDEISAVSIEEKIILFTVNTIGLKERRFWNLLETITGKDCEWQSEIPEEFLKSEFFEFYKNKVMGEGQ